MGRRVRGRGPTEPQDPADETASPSRDTSEGDRVYAASESSVVVSDCRRVRGCQMKKRLISFPSRPEEAPWSVLVILDINRDPFWKVIYIKYYDFRKRLT